MADEVVVKMGVPGFPASGTLGQGAVVKVDANGKWTATAAGDEVWFALLEDAVADQVVAGRYEIQMKVLVTGENDLGAAALAAGDKVYVDVGVLNGDAVNNGAAVGYLLEPVASGVTALTHVLVQK